jgi:hypothetical protein
MLLLPTKSIHTGLIHFPDVLCELIKIPNLQFLQLHNRHGSFLKLTDSCVLFNVKQVEVLGQKGCAPDA